LPIYERSEDGGALRQGEIVTGLQRGLLNLAALTEGVFKVDLEPFRFVVLISQDCDLEQDHYARARGSDAGLRDLLFLAAVPLDEFRGLLPAGGDIWKRVKQNKDERYQVLERVPANSDILSEGLPALGLDFKRHFTMLTPEVLFRIREGTARRRARLATPWAEHLLSRFAYYQGRVALPQDHDVSLT